MIHADISLFSVLNTEWFVRYYRGNTSPFHTFSDASRFAETTIRENRKHAINELHARCTATICSGALTLFSAQAHIYIDYSLHNNELITSIRIL